MQLLLERPKGALNAFSIEGALFKCCPGEHVDSASCIAVRTSVLQRVASCTNA